MFSKVVVWVRFRQIYTRSNRLKQIAKSSIFDKKKMGYYGIFENFTVVSYGLNMNILILKLA